MPENSTNLIETVRKALGRTAPLAAAPVPPMLDEALIRLVQPGANLVETFIKAATEAKFKVETAAASNICSKLVEFIKSQNCKRIGFPVSDLLQRLNVPAALKDAGITAQSWDELTLDSAYDLDCGVTDVYTAVAETGSLVIRADPKHGRALSLLPPIHIAIIEPANLVPDLIDLFEQFARQTPTPAFTLITGPSKTADIEGSLVTGVHGPGLVKLFVLI
ncbi:MAG: LUD domain-containing protein [Planctomycetota bacterium]|nr:LUD domain-containing protein [Planctomycetota bacterium]